MGDDLNSQRPLGIPESDVRQAKLWQMLRMKLNAVILFTAKYWVGFGSRRHRDSEGFPKHPVNGYMEGVRLSLFQRRFQKGGCLKKKEGKM